MPDSLCLIKPFYWALKLASFGKLQSKKLQWHSIIGCEQLSIRLDASEENKVIIRTQGEGNSNTIWKMFCMNKCCCIVYVTSLSEILWYWILGVNIILPKGSVQINNFPSCPSANLAQKFQELLINSLFYQNDANNILISLIIYLFKTELTFLI